MEHQATTPATVILDTNFLLIPATFGVDIFSEIQRIYPLKHQFAVVGPTLAELEIIKGRPGKQASAAKLALSLIKAKNINTLPTAVKHTDDAIVAVAQKQGNCVVATQDLALRSRLKKAGISVIVLRQKKYLMML